MIKQQLAIARFTESCLQHIRALYFVLWGQVSVSPPFNRSTFHIGKQYPGKHELSDLGNGTKPNGVGGHCKDLQLGHIDLFSSKRSKDGTAGNFGTLWHFLKRFQFQVPGPLKHSLLVTF